MVFKFYTHKILSGEMFEELLMALNFTKIVIGKKV